MNTERIKSVKQEVNGGELSDMLIEGEENFIKALDE